MTTDQKVRMARDVVLGLAGLAGIAHETLSSGRPDASLLLLFGGMVGLPAFLRRDDREADK